MDLDDDGKAKLRIFLTHVEEIMEALEYVSEMLRSTTRQTDAEVDRFELVCGTVGKMWRTYFGRSVPPKLHLLESHFPAEFRKYHGRIGFFGEDAVERQHNITNKFNRVFVCVAGFKYRQEAIQSAKNQGGVASVDTILEKASSSSKRKVTGSSEQRKKAAKASKAERSAGKRQEFGERIRVRAAAIAVANDIKIAHDISDDADDDAEDVAVDDDAEEQDADF